MASLNSMDQSTRPFILPLFFIRKHWFGSLFRHFQKSPFKAKKSQFSSLHFEICWSRRDTGPAKASSLWTPGPSQHHQNGTSKQKSTKMKGYKGRRATPWLLRFFSRELDATTQKLTSFVPRQQWWINSNRKRFIKKQIINNQQSTGTVEWIKWSALWFSHVGSFFCNDQQLNLILLKLTTFTHLMISFSTLHYNVV